MASKICLTILFLLTRQIQAIIYDLNDTEYSRMPPIFMLADYDSCMEDPEGMYCSVRLDLYAETTNELMRTIQEYSEFKIKHYDHSYLEWSVCVSKTCRNHLNHINVEEKEALNAGLEACLNETIASKYELYAKLGDVYHCEKKGEKIPIDYLDWIAIVLLLAVIGLNVKGTWLDLKKNPITNNEYISCFSIRQNWRTLIKTEHPKQLKGISGIRCLASLVTTMSHALMLNVLFVANPHDVEKAYENMAVQIVSSNFVTVQMFVVMSGSLHMYNLLTTEEKKPISWSEVRKKLVLRWSRIAPGHITVVLVCATWFRAVRGGSSWLLRRSGDQCRQYLAHHILGFNNYVPDNRHCAMHTWYVSADFQLFTLGLLVVLLTQKKCRLITIAALLVLGMILPAVHVLAWDLDAIVLAYPEFIRTMYSETFRYAHVFGHNNISCYALGMLTGSFLYWGQKNKLEVSSNNHLSKLVLPIMFFIFWLSRAIFDLESMSLGYRMLYAASHRVLYGLSCSMAIAFLVFNDPSHLARIFCWSGWSIPSRLSYSVYLLHAPVIYVLLGTRNQLVMTSQEQTILGIFAVIAISSLLAIPFYLMIEEPFNRVMKVYLDRRTKKHQVQETVPDCNCNDDNTKNSCLSTPLLPNKKNKIV